MAKIAGTVTTTDIKGNREDLSDMIYNISPTETPLLSAAGKDDADAIFTEWQIDALATADGANFQPEGNVNTFALPAMTTRVGNVCQISDKTAIVSGTVDAVKKAGRKNEMGYQMAKRSKELKRDIATIMTANQAAASADPRKTGGILAWLKTNVSLGATGVNPVYTTSPTGTRTDGTQRAFTEVILKAVLSSMFDNGAEGKNIYMSGTQKQVFSTFTGQYAKTFDTSKIGPSAIIASADVYVGDFNTLKVVPNRFQRSRDVLIIDPEFLKIAYLRPFHTEALAKDGDANKRVIRAEWALKVLNEAAHGLVADLT